MLDVPDFKCGKFYKSERTFGCFNINNERVGFCERFQTFYLHSSTLHAAGTGDSKDDNRLVNFNNETSIEMTNNNSLKHRLQY